jgi:dTDP-4-amino-4,6-dideoxygalactose transaminase
MTPEKIQMVDLYTQYEKVQPEMDHAILDVVRSTQFINGQAVKSFTSALSDYLDNAYVIPCANGTDALQIALMALDLKQDDEVIVPAFTYVATAEVIGLLGLKPIMVDVDPYTFNTTAELINPRLTDRTKAIIPVHLFGQSTDMEDILILAKDRGIAVIEDNAQAIGAKYTFRDGSSDFTGCMGDMGTTSFFPSKNLGCYGDGGAMTTRDHGFALKMQMIANHGQSKKYHHQVIGCNSRLDTIQAAVLEIKLKHLNKYSDARQAVAKYYDNNLAGIDGLITPTVAENSTHVYHQYTLRVLNGKRNDLKAFLADHGVPSMIYYPLPLYKQVAFQSILESDFDLPVSEQLSHEVLSLPIHTEMPSETQDFIIETIKKFDFS